MSLFRRDEDLNCQQVARLMHGFLDGEIPAHEAEMVAAHLDKCERCGIEAATFRRVKSAIRALRPDLDADALSRLSTYVDEVASGRSH